MEKKNTGVVNEQVSNKGESYYIPGEVVDEVFSREEIEEMIRKGKSDNIERGYKINGTHVISVSEHLFSGYYKLFLNIFDTKIYRIFINVQRIVVSDTSFILLTDVNITNKDACDINTSILTEHTARNKNYIEISEYNDEIFKHRNILITKLNRVLNSIVQSKYITDIKVDIKNTELNSELVEFYNSLLILENTPSTSCVL